MVGFDADRNARAGAIALNGHRFDFGAKELLDEAGEPVRLRPQCLAVLRCLADSPGRVVTREDLMRSVWPGMVVTDDSLVQCIGELRRALGDADHRLVRTERRRGYRLVPASAASPEPTPDGGTQEVRFATSYDGVSIAYACCGDGVPVVRERGMSHLGYDMDCPANGPILRAMASRHRLIRFDRRSQGLSDRRVKAYTLEEAVHDLLAVVDAEGVSRFVLWGLGAMPAIRFAARYPDRVERLILCGGSARGLAERRDGVWGNTGLSGDRMVEALWEDENSTIRSGGGPGGLCREYPTGTAAQARSHDRLKMLSCTGEAAVGAWHAAKYWNVVADLEHVRCPTLVLHSRRNRTLLLEEAELMAARIPDARLVILDTDNWLPLPQEPAFDEMVREIHAFIAQGELARALSAPAEPAASHSLGGGGR